MICIRVIFFLLLSAAIMLLFTPSKEKKYNFSFSKTKADIKRKKMRLNSSLTTIERINVRIESLLNKIGRDKSYFYRIIVICSVGGFIVGIVCFNDFMLALATSVVATPISYLVLILQTQEATRYELSEIQNAMSIITNAYLANNNIIKSVEQYIHEKNRYLTTEERALKKITPFEEFVTTCAYINPNVDAALEKLAISINNKHFTVWVKNLRLCIENSDMRFSLEPVLQQMSDEKLLQMESDSIMRKTWQNYFTMLALMFSVILIFRICNRAWYLILTDTPVGKIIILGMLISAILSSLFVVKLNKPISNS